MDNNIVRVEIKEEPLDAEELEEKASKIRSILSNEFRNEIQERETEIIQIQEEIQKTQKFIEILKYAASCELFDEKVEVPIDDNQGPVEHAIHPCIKSLLQAQAHAEENPKTIDVEDTDTLDTLNQNAEDKVVAKENLTIVRGTYRVKHQLVIGNVSKWIPPSFRESNITHKWMMYVRDKGRDGDLSQIIKKVRYFLHESYKPNDIIDVYSAPFHLTRRGWGEFPVRVTIFFNHPMNKPIDLIHDLKLDLTFSGNQVLGRETVIEANLFHDDLVPTQKDEQSAEPVADISKPFDLIAIEHNYFATEAHESDNKNYIKMNHVVSCPLLSKNVFQDSISELEKYNFQTDGPLIDWFNSLVMQKVSSIYFFSTENCVKWFLNRWPIITPHCLNTKYKTVHPYTFPTVQTYIKSTVGKRRAAEWFRANKIKTFVKALNLSPWTTKQIMLYARMHGYVYFMGRKFNVPPCSIYKNINTYTKSINTTENLRQLESKIEDDEIDILDDDMQQKQSPIKKNNQVLDMSSDLTNFVEATSRQIGIKFGNEEVADGISTNAAAAMMTQVLELFLENLSRKSFCNAWLRNMCQNPESLAVEDVVKTLMETPEFDIFTNAGLGSKHDT